MLFVVDVESNGPVPGLYSMICFGAVAIDGDGLQKTFYGQTRPLEGAGTIPEAQNISGISLGQQQGFEEPGKVMQDFAKWITEVNKDGRPIFVSDNPAFDWQFINYYFHLFTGSNPFGFSARRIGDFYAGLERNYFARWKHLRKTSHDHNPVNDAIGNAEALISMAKKFGVKLPGI